MKRIRNKPGLFSLVELIIVIVVLAVLFAILIPGLSHAKEYAYDLVCKSNIRQIGMAYRAYAADNRNLYPVVDRWLDDFKPVYPYIRTLGIFVCPKSNTEALTSYDDLTGNTDYYAGATITDIEKCENNGHGNNPYDFDISNPSTVTQAVVNSKTNRRCIYDKYYLNHFDQLNVLFLDNLTFEKVDGVAEFWTLDKDGKIETSLDPYPDIW